MKEISVVGVDVSKTTLDFFIKPFALGLTTSNDQEGFKQWWAEMIKMMKPGTHVLVIILNPS
jgi:hypothetical protein